MLLKNSHPQRLAERQHQSVREPGRTGRPHCGLGRRDEGRFSSVGIKRLRILFYGGPRAGASDQAGRAERGSKLGLWCRHSTAPAGGCGKRVHPDALLPGPHARPQRPPTCTVGHAALSQEHLFVGHLSQDDHVRSIPMIKRSKTIKVRL